MNLSMIRPGKKTLIALTLLLLLAGPAIAMAAGGNGTSPGTSTGVFDDLYDFLKGLLSGSLGKLLTIIALAVALVIAVKVQNVIGILSAFAIALCAVYGPTALESLFTASLPVAELASTQQPAMPLMPPSDASLAGAHVIAPAAHL